MMVQVAPIIMEAESMLGVKLDARAFLDRVAQELGRINPAEVKALADAIHRCYLTRRFIFLIGNGGSGSNASHFCEDLGKCTLRREDFDNDNKKRLRILSLTDNTPYILAWANDEGFERVFVEQLKNLASAGDLLIAISGSGNSPNILRAVEWANRNGLETFGCTGFSGGKLRALAQHGLHVPLDDMGIVESIHLAAFHWVVDNLHARLAADDNHREPVSVPARSQQRSDLRSPPA
jgi:D-sedoheptulose 7-phosphate isomerase